jgi:putative FmdB family regulatory protein
MLVPIYAYRCEACGFAKDALQKVSDAPLTDCPACGEAKFKKQLTAAGFQLKGTGWYVTDFRNGSNAAKPGAQDATKSDSAEAGGGENAAAGGANAGGDNSSSSTARAQHLAARLIAATALRPSQRLPPERVTHA